MDDCMHERDAGIAKVLIAAGAVRDPITGLMVDNAGMGIVVDSRHVLTCAHVVNTAVGEPIESGNRPDRKVKIVFPLSKNAQPIEGTTTTAWYPIEANPISDVAVIELDEDVPNDVGIATFAPIDQPLDGQWFDGVRRACRSREGKSR
jgi:hypothetical protein